MVLEIKWPRMWGFGHLNSTIKRFRKSLRKEEQKTILILKKHTWCWSGNPILVIFRKSQSVNTFFAASTNVRWNSTIQRHGGIHEHDPETLSSSLDWPHIRWTEAKCKLFGLSLLILSLKVMDFVSLLLESRGIIWLVIRARLKAAPVIVWGTPAHTGCINCLCEGLDCFQWGHAISQNPSSTHWKHLVHYEAKIWQKESSDWNPRNPLSGKNEQHLLYVTCLLSSSTCCL